MCIANKYCQDKPHIPDKVSDGYHFMKLSNHFNNNDKLLPQKLQPTHRDYQYVSLQAAAGMSMRPTNTFDTTSITETHHFAIRFRSRRQ